MKNIINIIDVTFKKLDIKTICNCCFSEFVNNN